MKKIIILLLAFLANPFAFSQIKDKFISQTNAEFAKTISNKTVQLVDVRTLSEYSSGHIASALHINVNRSDFKKRAAKLNKKHPVAVYCRSGARSKMAARILVAMGFNVYELNEGITHWDGEIKKTSN